MRFLLLSFVVGCVPDATGPVSRLSKDSAGSQSGFVVGKSGQDYQKRKLIAKAFDETESRLPVLGSLQLFPYRNQTLSFLIIAREERILSVQHAKERSHVRDWLQLPIRNPL